MEPSSLWTSFRLCFYGFNLKRKEYGFREEMGVSFEIGERRGAAELNAPKGESNGGQGGFTIFCFGKAHPFKYILYT